MRPLPDPSAPLKNATHELFAQAIVAGERPVQAWKNTVGRFAKGLAKPQSQVLLKRKDIANRIEWLQRQVAQNCVISVQRYKELLSEAFLACAEGKDLYNLVKVGSLLGKAIGAEQPTEVTLRNGGVSDDYNPPPRIANLSDDELSGLVNKPLKNESEQGCERRKKEDDI